MNLFPFSEQRNVQKSMIEDIEKALEEKKHMILHAPTGLGKTVATLAPALAYALKKDINVFFLTSRHTQHMIAVNTLKEIKKKHDVDFQVIDMIGKKWLCAVEGSEKFFSNELTEYCKTQREEGLCEQYNNTKQKSKFTVEAKRLMSEIQDGPILNVEEAKKRIADEKMCPYYLMMGMAEKAKVIIGDYYHLFHPGVSETFLMQSGKKIENSIIIVDEGHNLPGRARELLTERLSNFVTKRAIKEAKDLKNSEIANCLEKMHELITQLGKETQDEKPITKDAFVQLVEKVTAYKYDELMVELDTLSELVRDEKKQSFCGIISGFMEKWMGEDEGYVRIISKQRGRGKEDFITVSYRCLDPSLITKPVIESSLMTILMSGTLTPTQMYKDLLGFPADAIEKTYPSPFEEENKLTLMIPETTTKYSARSEAQYERIAEIITEVSESIPGNVAIFFPSYYIMNEVYKKFFDKCSKTVFTEQPNLSKDEKAELFGKFEQYKKVGSVFLGVVSGSFGEGIDLPGDLLKGVVIVGLPLTKPNIETEALIKYFDQKFKKGWDYGYIFPAMNKTLQSAGRCIRTETDKGVVVFLDERYTWDNYYRCFPIEWKIKITKMYVDRIKEFFDKV